MEFPSRVPQHITETAAYKIFQNNIPNHWIVRDVSERDYGIDCYIELVNNKNQVTGELLSVQLKGIDGISWTKSNYYSFSGVKISTSNYWNKFPTPVFLCVVDTKTNEVFFCAVKSEIRSNFLSYAKQDAFTYRIEKTNKLENTDLKPFLLAYFREKEIARFENEAITFISHIQQYKEFVEQHSGRDPFLGVEIGRVLYLKHIYYNMKFICVYFDLPWNLKPLNEYFQISKSKFGDSYEIHALVMEEILVNLEVLITPILLTLKDIITNKEESYWIHSDLHLYNLMINVDDDGVLPDLWEY